MKTKMIAAITLLLPLLCQTATARNNRSKKDENVVKEKTAEGAVVKDDVVKTDVPADVNISEVVITGQYAPSSAERAVQKIKIIDRKKITDMSAQNLRDVLANELNIRLAQDNILGSSVNVQGIGGQNVKILIDGVPVIGRQDGNIDLSQISLNNIERVEIVEGPMSVSYGTDALAGTINLITRKTQKDPLEAGLSTYYESIGTYNVNGRLGFHKQKHTLLLTGGRNFFDGWNNGEKLSFDFGAVPADSNRVQQWKPKEQYLAGLQYIYREGKTTYNYKADYFNETITNRGMPGTYGERASDDYYHTYRFDNALFINTTVLNSSHINFQAAYNRYKRIKNTYSRDLTTLTDQLSSESGAQDTSGFNQFSSRATFSTANRDIQLNYEAGYDINIENATGIRIAGNKKQIGDYAAFASVEYKPLNQLTIRPGLRYAYNSAYTAPLTPSLNVRYKLNEHITFRASYARGFRAPSLKELYFYFVDVNHNIKGNEQLVPEYSDSYNASAGYNVRTDDVSVKLDAAFFYNDMHNRIELAQLGSSATYTYVNIGRYKTLGAQLNAEFGYHRLKVLVGGAYTGRYNNLSETGNVATFSYAPELRGNLSYEFAQPGVTVSLYCKYTGKLPGFAQDAAGQTISTTVSSYTIADVSISKAFFGKKLAIAAGCKNLLDVKNLSVSGANVSTGAPHSTGGDMPIGTGRSFFLKADININGK